MKQMYSALNSTETHAKALENLLLYGNSSKSPGYLADHPITQWLFAVVLSGITIVGFLGNILIIITVTTIKALRTQSNMFVVNLAVADLMITTVVDPFNVAGAFLGQPYFVENRWLCEVIASLCAPACACSVLSICAISINRYVLICHYHLYNRIFTWKKTGCLCLAMWMLAYTLHFPNYVGWGKNEFDTLFYVCTFSTTNHSYAMFFLGIGLVMPMIAIIYCYTSIFLRYRKVKQNIRSRHKESLEGDRSPLSDARIVKKIEISESPNRHKTHKMNGTTGKTSVRKGFIQDDIRLARTLLMVFIAFVVCWAPFALLVLAKLPTAMPGWVYLLAILMGHGNSSVNFILYGLTNEKFRQGYMTALRIRHQNDPASALSPVSRLSTNARKNLTVPTLASYDSCDLVVSAHFSAQQDGEVLIVKKTKSKVQNDRKKYRIHQDSWPVDQLLPPNGIVIIIPESP